MREFNDSSLDSADWTPEKRLEVGLRLVRKGTFERVTLSHDQAEALLEIVQSQPQPGGSK